MPHDAHARWLAARLPELVAEGVLSPEAADRLAARFPVGDDDRASRAAVVVGALGALLVGGGVILVLAHNWSDLSRAVRTVLSLAPAVVGAAFAAWALARPTRTAWREAAATTWSLAVLASLALVAQTYHLSGDPAALVLAWVLLTAPIVYLCGSAAAALLHLGGALAWISIRDEAGLDSVLFWVLVAWVVPLAIHLARPPRRAAAGWLAWGLALAAAIGIPSSLGLLVDLLPGPVLASGFLALFLAGRAARGPTLGRPAVWIGGGAFVVTLLVLSFSDTFSIASRPRAADWMSNLTIEGIVAVVLVAAALAAWWRAGRAREDAAWALGLPLVWAAQLVSERVGETEAMLLVNLYLLGFGVHLLARGFRGESLATANLGAAVLAAVIVARFFDSDLGFLTRGIAFIVAGIGFFAVNWVLLRRRRAGKRPAEIPA